MEYYLAIKRNELLTFTKTWMNLKAIILSERSQTQKIACCRTPFIQNFRKGKVTCSDRKQITGCLAGRVVEVKAGGRQRLQRGWRRLLGVTDRFVILRVVITHEIGKNLKGKHNHRLLLLAV